MIEKILSLTAESWNDIFQAVSVIAAAIAFVALVGTALTGRKVGQRQAEKILALDKEVAEARTKQAEAERALLDLQQAVAPRRWPNQVASAQALKPFAGVTYILEYFDRDDCPEIAGQIAGTLGLAGWRIDGPHPSQDRYLTTDGIEIQFGVGHREDSDVSGGAVIVLAEQLLDRNLDFQLRPAGTQLPPNTIRIKVSVRPVTRILSEEERGIREEARKRQRESLELYKRIEAQRLKSLEKQP